MSSQRKQLSDNLAPLLEECENRRFEAWSADQDYKQAVEGGEPEAQVQMLNELADEAFNEFVRAALKVANLLLDARYNTSAPVPDRMPTGRIH
jgi:hypothetical protein